MELQKDGVQPGLAGRAAFSGWGRGARQPTQRLVSLGEAESHT